MNEGRPNAVDLIKNGQIQMVINTPGGMVPRRDENAIRSAAYAHNVCLMTTITGAAAAVGLVLPHLNGKLDGFAIRVPTINVSIVDLTFVAKRAVSADEVNKAVKEASETDLKGVLDYNADPLVSSDFNNNPASSIFDATLTKAEGTLVKVSGWYDNEWGYASRCVDLLQMIGKSL